LIGLSFEPCSCFPSPTVAGIPPGMARRCLPKQKAPTWAGAFLQLVPEIGIEPTTYHMRTRYKAYLGSFKVDLEYFAIFNVQHDISVGSQANVKDPDLGSTFQSLA